MITKKSFTLEYTAGVLRKKGLVSEEQEREILIKGEAQRARLKKSRESFYSSRRLHTITEAVSPAEVIASLSLTVPAPTGPPGPPGSPAPPAPPGRVLTEDMIT
ncbi:MAG TPA: hypothetical protein VJM57_09490 [Thermodesulfobacteriota bacterium]|nr:hypothetical protein [Thermodesulfobacteriota bacterium]